MSTTDERNAQLLAVGKQCSHPQCSLVDFLPFRCQHCQQSFCQEHYRVQDGHQCAKYDESKHNRVAPECPLCTVPIAVQPGEDPNVRMDQHLDNECRVVTGRVQAKRTPICARNNCKKILLSPIRCDQCQEQFCPSHRFPSDHTCKAPAARPAPARPGLPSLASASSMAKNLNTKASSKASGAVSSMKESVAAAKASTSTAAASASRSMPFNKTDSTVSLPFPWMPAPSLTTNMATSTSTTTLPDNEPTQRPPPIIHPLPAFTPRSLFGWA